MQTLIFNTNEKTVKLYSGVHCPTFSSDLLWNFNNVPTVKVLDGLYEIMQEENNMKYPVLRVPIANTNMIIIK
jgi:hypothetical protein